MITCIYHPMLICYQYDLLRTTLRGESKKSFFFSTADFFFYHMCTIKMMHAYETTKHFQLLQGVYTCNPNVHTIVFPDDKWNICESSCTKKRHEKLVSVDTHGSYSHRYCFVCIFFLCWCVKWMLESVPENTENHVYLYFGLNPKDIFIS